MIYSCYRLPWPFKGGPGRMRRTAGFSTKKKQYAPRKRLPELAAQEPAIVPLAAMPYLNSDPARVLRGMNRSNMEEAPDGGGLRSGD